MRGAIRAARRRAIERPASFWIVWVAALGAVCAARLADAVNDGAFAGAFGTLLALAAAENRDRRAQRAAPR